MNPRILSNHTIWGSSSLYTTCESAVKRCWARSLSYSFQKTPDPNKSQIPNMRRPLVLRQPGAWVCRAAPPPAAGTAGGEQAGEAGARSSKGDGARPGPAAAALSLCQSTVPRAIGFFVSLPGMFPCRWTAQGRVYDRRTCLPGQVRPGPPALPVVAITPRRGRHGRGDRHQPAAHHPGALTRRKARRQQPIVDLPGHRKAVERGRR
jgi:hypothetical protein